MKKTTPTPTMMMTGCGNDPALGGYNTITTIMDKNMHAHPVVVLPSDNERASSLLSQSARNFMASQDEQRQQPSQEQEQQEQRQQPSQQPNARSSRPLPASRRSGSSVSSSLSSMSSFQRRSKSPAARHPHPRDIVKEVYDRMGIQYARDKAKNTIELDDATSVVSIQSGGGGRGGGGGGGDTNHRISITKSPGRARGTNWSSSPMQSSTASSTGNKSKGLVSTSLLPANKRAAFALSSSASSSFRSQKADARDDSPGFRQPHSTNTKTPAKAEKRDDVDGTSSVVSIKSRISTFGGGKGIVSASALNKIKSRKPKDYRKSDSSVAASFLAAVSSSKQPSTPEQTPQQDVQSVGAATQSKGGCIPVVIHSSDFHNFNDSDDHSIAASSVSGEDFAGASTKTPRGGGDESASFKYTNNSESRTVHSFSRRFSGENVNSSSNINNSKSTSSTYKSATEQMIERIVDERVALKLKAMAESMTAETQRIREEMKARVDELEHKLMLLNMSQS